MQAARMLDRVLINNVSEDDCPPQIVGIIIEGAPNVLIEGLPAARLGDRAILSCAACGGGLALPIEGSASVFTGGLPAHRQTIDRVISGCGGGSTITGAARTAIGG